MDKNDVSSGRRFEIQYEKFCKNPRAIMDDLQLFLEYNNCTVSRKNCAPAQFATNKSIRIDPEIYYEMARYAKKH